MTDSGVPSIPVRAISVESDSASDGSEVETVVAELSDGTQLSCRIAEHFLLVNELDGVERKLTVLVHPGDGVRRLDDVSPRIERSEAQEAGRSFDVYGVITDCAVDPIRSGEGPFDVLDVGVGSVYVHHSVRDHLEGTDLTLDPGDALYMPSSELEMWDLYP